MLCRSVYIVVLLLLAVLGLSTVNCTSAQNLHNLLRHPHYADGHQHSPFHHLQHATSHPARGPHDSGAPTVPHHSSRGTAPTSSTGPWSRVGTSKDYYRMNGYPFKTTSASKTSTLVDPRIPQELSDVREANDHFVRMRSGAYCRWPRPQVFCVRDLYPGKELLPRCTLLHRCTETSGCCEDAESECAPKAMQEVLLHFYVLSSDHLSKDVEKLFFVNHTECECQAKSIPKTTTAITSPSTTTTTAAPNITNAVEYHHTQRDQQNPKCRSCPSPFCIREYEDGRCSCDCFDRHKPCIRIKRGRESLSEVEKRCVESGHCNIPDCDYGPYDMERGRCPKRPEHLGPKDGEGGMKRPLPNHKNPNHRWIYFERD